MPPMRTQLQDKSNRQDTSPPPHYAAGAGAAQRSSSGRHLISDPYASIPPIPSIQEAIKRQRSPSTSRSSPERLISPYSRADSAVLQARQRDSTSPATSVDRRSSVSVATGSNVDEVARQQRRSSVPLDFDDPSVRPILVDQLKQQGNEAVTSSRLVDAFVIFSVCIDELPWEPAYYLNRSLVAYRLNLFNVSIQDAQRALRTIEGRRGSASETTLRPLPPASKSGKPVRAGPIRAGLEATWHTLETKAYYREAMALYSLRRYTDAAAVLARATPTDVLSEQIAALQQQISSQTPPPDHVQPRRLFGDEAKDRVAAAKGETLPVAVFASKEELEERQKRVKETWRRGERVL